MDGGKEGGREEYHGTDILKYILIHLDSHISMLIKMLKMCFHEYRFSNSCCHRDRPVILWQRMWHIGIFEKLTRLTLLQ